MVDIISAVKQLALRNTQDSPAPEPSGLAGSSFHNNWLATYPEPIKWTHPLSLKFAEIGSNTDGLQEEFDFDAHLVVFLFCPQLNQVVEEDASNTPVLLPHVYIEIFVCPLLEAWVHLWEEG